MPSPRRDGGAIVSRYRFLKRFGRLAFAYWRSGESWKAWSLTISLVMLTLAQVLLAIWTNYWNRALFDALGDRSVSRFLAQIGIFAIIFVLTMSVTATHLQVKKRLQIGWRKWLTEQVVDRWMSEKRHYHLTFIPGEHDNPDGRIAVDINVVTEIAIALAHTLVYSILILGTFIDILLSVAGDATLSVKGASFQVPGYMVLLSFAYAGIGSALGFLLGKPLVRSTNRLQNAEADFRFGLARARDKSESIALAGGEPMERQHSRRLFEGIRDWWMRQTFAYTWILFFTSGYGALLPVFPILVVAPQYISGAITLGVLMQTAQAFEKLTSALSWPIDHLAEMAQWRASAERVLSLHEDVDTLDLANAETETNSIEIGTAADDKLVIRDLRIARPDGQLVLDGLDIELSPGENVLIDGDAAPADDLFKAVAGLWPWGRGKVLLPVSDSVFFMPQSPYVPDGTLKAALTYPEDAALFDDEACRHALDCAGLGYLTPRLGETDSWEHVLTTRGQQRLGFARLFLRRSRWIFMEEATDAFDPKGEIRMMETVRARLPASTIIMIGFHASLEPFFHRKINLRRAPDGKYLFGGPPAGMPPAPPETDKSDIDEPDNAADSGKVA